MVNLIVLIIIQNWDVVHNMLTRPEAAKVLREMWVDQRKNKQNNLHVLQSRD